MNRDIDRLDPAFDPRIADWLEADPDRAPREVLETVVAAMPSIPQRRALRAPWRLPEMLTPARAAVAAVLGVLLVGGAIFVFQRPGWSNVGGPQLSVSPSHSASTSDAPGASSPLGLAIIGLDGSVRQDLRLPVDAWMADLSSDGSKVAFTTSDKGFGFCGGCGEPRYAAVAAIGATGGHYLYPEGDVVSPGGIEHLTWSPDGTRLAFVGLDPTGNRDIYVGDVGSVDGSQVAALTIRRLTTDPAIDEFPAWTPDGETIVYANLGSEPPDDSGFSYTQEIWRVSVDGGTPVRLTNNQSADTMPDVRADGLVVFWREGQTFTIDLEGTGEARLRNAPDAFNPRWSPDGSKLAMLRYDPSDRARFPATYAIGPSYPLLDVIVVDLATGKITPIGPRVASDVNPPSWTPDGEALLIARYDDGG